MKKRYLQLIIAGLLITGFFSCKPSLHQKIRSMALDGEISQKEFSDLLKFAGADEKLHKYTNPKALFDYIESDLAKANPAVKVWNPYPQTGPQRFNVNVYIENSASIDGYVNETEMKNAVYDMLGNIKTVCDTLNLNYINSEILNQVKNANSANSKDFILNLTPASFRNRGGKRGESDMADILARVLTKTNNTNLSVLISDFVFSPGSGVDAAKYLNFQKIQIRDILRDKLRNENLAIAVYQMTAAFNGKYFDHNNSPEPFNGERPYYIWLIGAHDEVNTLIKKPVISDKGYGYLNKVVFVTTKEPSILNHQIVKVDKTGNFSLGGGDDEIKRAATANGKFGFSIAIDFSSELRDEKYFSDSENYIVSDKGYSINARELSEQEKASPDLMAYTHLVTLTSGRLLNQDLQVKVISRLPEWVEKSNCTDDSDINRNQAEQSRTFGLSYLMDGVMDAFNSDPDLEKNIIAEFKIKINK